MLTTTRKQPSTTSNWLDRLRSSKGFPPEDTNLDLDHFLLNSTPNNHNDEPKRVPPEPTTTSQPPPTTPFQLVENILSDLFYFGNNNNNNNKNSNKKKKGSRKQREPRCFCTSEVEDNSSGCGRKDENALLLASTASLNHSGGFEEVKGEEEEEEEEGREVLRGYSRSEVTVIDTSCQGWKFEKVVFRRKDVWKVRDKKGRPGWDGERKRKRSGGLELESKKKNKKKKKKKKKEVRKLQHEKMEEVCKFPQNDDGHFLKKSFPLSGSPKKSKKIGSSAIQNRNLSDSSKSGKKIHMILLKESKTLRLETSPIELCN